MAALIWAYACYGGILRVLLVAVGLLTSVGFLVVGAVIQNPVRQKMMSEISVLASYVFLVLGVVSCAYNCLEMQEAIRSGIMRADVPAVHIVSGLYVYAVCSLVLALVSIGLRLRSHMLDQVIS